MQKKQVNKEVMIRADTRITEIVVYPDTSLIENKIGNDTLMSLRGTQQGWHKQPRAPKDVAKCYENATYWHPGGGYGVPAIMFKQALINACRYVEGLTMAQMKGCIFVMHDNDPETQLIKLEGVRRCKEDVVRLANGSIDLHYRPYFWPWRVTLRIKHDPNLLTVEQLGGLIAKAGIHVGIGDWRPQGKEGTGQFGTFHPSRGKEDERFYDAEFKRMTAKIKAEGEIPKEYYTDPNADKKEAAA